MKVTHLCPRNGTSSHMCKHCAYNVGVFMDPQARLWTPVRKIRSKPEEGRWLAAKIIQVCRILHPFPHPLLCPSVPPRAAFGKRCPRLQNSPSPWSQRPFLPQTMPNNRKRFKDILYIYLRNGKLCRLKIENYQDWVVQRKILTWEVQWESKPKSYWAHSPGRIPRGQEQRKLKIRGKILGWCLLLPSYIYEMVLALSV